MKRIRYLVAALLALFAIQAQADVINGSFEAGFTGWTTSGVTAVIGAGGGGPIDGTSQAYLDTSPDNQFGPPDSSSISQTFFGGGHIKFWWNFLTNEFTPEDTFNDFAEVIVDGVPLLLADTFSTFVPSTLSGFAEMTGYMFTSIDLVGDGPHTIVFAVHDVADGGVDSALLVDAVAVPEPGALALLGLGLAGFGLARRRKQSA